VLGRHSSGQQGRLTEGFILAQDEVSFTGLIEQYRTPCVSLDEEDGLLELLEPLMELFVDLIRTGLSPLRGQTSSIYIRAIKVANGVLALGLIASWSITGWITATKVPHRTNSLSLNSDVYALLIPVPAPSLTTTRDVITGSCGGCGRVRGNYPVESGSRQNEVRIAVFRSQCGFIKPRPDSSEIPTLGAMPC
jgi:hypothetical protein